MPHSGGGGSHSGGSHSSGGGSHSSGSGGGGRSYRHSSRPFSGSRAYVIYNRMGQSRVVYTHQPNYHEEMTKGMYIMSLIFGAFFLVPGAITILAGLGMLISSFSFGYHKTTLPGSVDQSITILDEAQHLSVSETATLEQSLTDFRDHTGIIPAIEFTEDASWQQDYTDMESFAYNEYICHFDDEYHLLITYGYGAENTGTGFQEFHYETMWGDDLGKTAGEKDEEKLRNLLQKELARANGTEVGSAMSRVFDDYLAYYEAKGFGVDVDRLLPAVFMCIWGLLFGGGGVTIILSARKQYQKSQEEGVKTYKINGTPKILYCAYCGSNYYAGTIGTCPHCGAPLRAEES